MLARTIAAIGLGLGLAGAHQASAQGSMAGVWTTQFDIGIRTENGVETSLGKREARITLAVHGDSVTGTWQVAAQDGTAPSPVHLNGTRSGNKAELRSEPVERTLDMGDGPRPVKMVSVYKFELSGDALAGTSQNVATDGSFDGPERPFAATRVKP